MNRKKDAQVSCIDLLITNSKLLFMETKSFELRLSDYHYKIYIIHKTKFEKSEPRKAHLIMYLLHFQTLLLENIRTSFSNKRPFHEKNGS